MGRLRLLTRIQRHKHTRASRTSHHRKSTCIIISRSGGSCARTYCRRKKLEWSRISERTRLLQQPPETHTWIQYMCVYVCDLCAQDHKHARRPVISDFYPVGARVHLSLICKCMYEQIMSESLNHLQHKQTNHEPVIFTRLQVNAHGYT